MTKIISKKLDRMVYVLKGSSENWYEQLVNNIEEYLEPVSNYISIFVKNTNYTNPFKDYDCSEKIGENCTRYIINVNFTRSNAEKIYDEILNRIDEFEDKEKNKEETANDSLKQIKKELKIFLKKNKEEILNNLVNLESELYYDIHAELDDSFYNQFWKDEFENAFKIDNFSNEETKEILENIIEDLYEEWSYDEESEDEEFKDMFKDNVTIEEFETTWYSQSDWQGHVLLINSSNMENFEQALQNDEFTKWITYEKWIENIWKLMKDLHNVIDVDIYALYKLVIEKNDWTKKEIETKEYIITDFFYNLGEITDKNIKRIVLDYTEDENITEKNIKNISIDDADSHYNKIILDNYYNLEEIEELL